MYNSMQNRIKDVNEDNTMGSIDPTTKLLEKRRQMFEVQEALESQKTNFQLKVETFRKREEALRKKDLQLQESLVKFNRFLQENESKRIRAIARAEEEERQAMEKQKDIDKLTNDLNKFKEEQSILQGDVKKYQRYGGYLEKVMKFTEEFQEVGDILNRYNTLKSTNETLLQSQHDMLMISEEQRIKNLAFYKESQHQILKESNVLATYQKSLESAEESALTYQDHFDTIIWDTSNRILQLGLILVSVDNLLSRCQSKEHGKNLKYGVKKNIVDNDNPALALENQAMEYIEAATNGDIKEKGIECVSHLDDIKGFLLDFKYIIDSFDPSTYIKPVKLSVEKTPKIKSRTPIVESTSQSIIRKDRSDLSYNSVSATSSSNQ